MRRGIVAGAQVSSRGGAQLAPRVSDVLPRRRSRWAARKQAYMFASPALFLILVFVIFPLCYSLYLTFRNYDLAVGPPTEFVGLENYADQGRSTNARVLDQYRQARWRSEPVADRRQSWLRGDSRSSGRWQDYPCCTKYGRALSGDLEVFQGEGCHGGGARVYLLTGTEPHDRHGLQDAHGSLAEFAFYR